MHVSDPPRTSSGAGEPALAEIPVYRCRLEIVGTRATAAGPVLTPAEAADVLRAVLPVGADRIHVVALALDVRHRVLGTWEVSVGTLDAALISPRECLKAAILLNAASLILGMNHVSGDPGPSLETLTVARDIAVACEAAGIPLFDFIIIGAESFVSLRPGRSRPGPLRGAGGPRRFRSGATVAT